VIVYFFVGNKMFRKWVLERDFYRLKFFEDNVVESIEVDSTKSSTFPEIKITSSSPRILDVNKCPHIYIDCDEKQLTFICERCNEEIRFVEGV